MLGLDAAKGIIERYAATLAAMDDDPAAEILVGFLTYVLGAEKVTRCYQGAR